MTRDEAKRIWSKANPLQIYLHEIYEIIEDSAKKGNSEILFSGPPINLTYENWSSIDKEPTLKSKFIQQLKKDGYRIIENNDSRSLHKTIIIDWS